MRCCLIVDLMVKSGEVRINGDREFHNWGNLLK